MTTHLIDRLDRELKLDPQQRARIETIVEARRQRIDTLWSSVRPAVMQEIDATNAEIEKVLKPDQLEKFKAMETRMRNRVRGGPGHHGGMPPSASTGRVSGRPRDSSADVPLTYRRRVDSRETFGAL